MSRQARPHLPPGKNYPSGPALIIERDGPDHSGPARRPARQDTAPAVALGTGGRQAPCMPLARTMQGLTVGYTWDRAGDTRPWVRRFAKSSGVTGREPRPMPLRPESGGVTIGTRAPLAHVA